MRTRKGQKGEHHQAPSIHSQEKKKKAAKNWGAQNRTVQATTRRHYKEDTNRSQGRKKETASGGKKDRTKNLSQEPTEK